MDMGPLEIVGGDRSRNSSRDGWSSASALLLAVGVPADGTVPGCEGRVYGLEVRGLEGGGHDWRVERGCRELSPKGR